jgi:hypothetical protein
MKKAILFFMVILLATTVISGQITVLFPNGGEELRSGQTYNIRWTAPGVPGQVKITLLLLGSPEGVIIGSTANTGIYNWKISTFTDGRLVLPYTHYRVLVESLVNPAIRDSSDNDFRVKSEGITVFEPNGGENWSIGSSQVVKWNPWGISGNIKISLEQYGRPAGVVLDAIANNGLYNWTISTFRDGRPIKPGSNYRVLVESVINPGVKDRSDSDFTISGLIAVIPRIREWRAIQKLPIRIPLPDPDPWMPFFLLDVESLKPMFTEPQKSFDVELWHGNQVLAFLGRFKGKQMVQWNRRGSNNELGKGRYLKIKLNRQQFQLVSRGGPGFTLKILDAQSGKALHTSPITLMAEKFSK